MEILKIKHRLLIDGMWETLILENNEPRVYIRKEYLYTRDMYEKERDFLLNIYAGRGVLQLDEIFNKDWSQYN